MDEDHLEIPESTEFELDDLAAEVAWGADTVETDDAGLEWLAQAELPGVEGIDDGAGVHDETRYA
ncbi:hypothetical protein [Actinokineospora sp. NBRC 105648]|uniref:hypothetical protein n=1 Tax=Actinokineospora sp. NBRC 105648 TaxID=3032206 RepID=UPI00255279AE|nr:hypothetical protein [Actinokineospora sp. NBRC 105648]